MRYRYIYLVLSFLILTGCIKDGDIDTGGNTTVLNIGIITKSQTSKSDANPVVGDSFSVEKLRIFAFNNNGTLDKMEYLEYPTPMTSAFNHSIEVSMANKKLIYVLVNEPAELSTQLANIKSRSELTFLNYTIAESINKKLLSGDSFESVNFVTPMSAYREIDASHSYNLVISLDRVVARLDFYVDKDEKAMSDKVEFTSSTNITVNGLNYTSSLFEMSTLNEPLTTNSVSSSVKHNVLLEVEDYKRGNAKKLFSLYMAERSYDEADSENNITIKIDNIELNGVVTELNSNIVLGRNVTPLLKEINRNYLYQIYATYRGEDKAVAVSNEYVIVDWQKEEIEGDIEGVMLAVTDAVAMDWYKNNNSFTSEDISFGSNKPIEVYIPVLDGGANSSYTFKKCSFVANKGATYDLRDLKDYNIPDSDNFALAIPWLTDAKITFTTEQTGYMTFTYKLGDSPNYLDVYPIQFVSGNVRKEMKVIYDNGYVPGDILQSKDKVGCWGNSPSGIAFAKRGDALHPLITPEILDYNSDGLYEGDIKLTAEEADAYCKEKLGPTWYAPNKDQLADIQRYVLELGRSYRYNNIADSYYWSSGASSTANNFWAVDMTKGLVEPSPLDLPKSEQHYVRCITNL